MTKSRLPTLPGLDTLLQEQAVEMATLRAARSDRHAMESDRTPKWYRLGPESPDGTLPIDVADRGADNWRERETCPNVEHGTKAGPTVDCRRHGVLPWSVHARRRRTPYVIEESSQ